jgi:hypothetical protein
MRLRLEKSVTEPPRRPYQNHLPSSDDLVTTYEAIRAGFVALALEKNRRATPHIEQARALQSAASQAKTPADLLHIEGIESGLLTAAGLSDKSLDYLQPQDKREAVDGLIKNFLEPAGADEHWKTARAALDRIREAFSKAGHSPYTFFIGAAIEKKMASEIWGQLEGGTLSNAANLNKSDQVASISRWLCTL